MGLMFEGTCSTDEEAISLLIFSIMVYLQYTSSIVSANIGLVAAALGVIGLIHARYLNI